MSNLDAIVRIENLSKRFAQANKPALEKIEAMVYPGKITGLVGPDGSGKTTLVRLMAGLLHPSEGNVHILGKDMASQAVKIQPYISYMPQRFGLYEDLSILENLQLYSTLHDVTGEKRDQAFSNLLQFTGLERFQKRLAGNLSGGMKQKLGLACALIEKPRLLLLDEPCVGVDPISRRELWKMVQELLDDSMAVIWSTAYLDEAEKCDSVLLLNEGKVLFSGPPAELTDQLQGKVFQLQNIEKNKRQVLSLVLNDKSVLDGVIQGENVRVVLKTTGEPLEQHSPGARLVEVQPRFEDAFISILGGGPGGYSELAAFLPDNKSESHVVIEAEHLTKQFGEFKAANNISFSIRSGEIFGLLGPNGAGKSTTFKMLCGLLRPSSGTAKVSGYSLQSAPGKARSRIGYMAQKFSLYGNLSALQNLEFFAGAYGLKGRAKKEAIQRMVKTFALKPYLDTASCEMPLGFKQRLVLACSIMHNPDVLFLDEPTSGVDPITRREFWTHINGMVEKGVTVLVTTHFMDEAEYCDRIALVYRGEVIAMGEPDELRNKARSEDMPNPSIEDAFITLVEAFDRRKNSEEEIA